MGKNRDDFGLLGPLFEAALAEESPKPVAPTSQPAAAPSTPPSAPAKAPAASVPQVYTVTELATELRDSLKDQYPRILVRGEIADFKGIHRSGHLYCALKDESSQIRLVVWKSALSKVPFKIEAGQEVIVTARVDFYPGGGSLQLSAESLEPVGIGALQLRFEQLKAKLQTEGLFETSRKKAIPQVCWNIALVTGKSTAALQDMLKIFRHRFPLARIFIFHASVQGEKAPEEICRALRSANEYSQTQTKLDCLILARGGGSYEDLFCFNDETLARTLAASTLPTITGIGHEIDVTIADMVADRRAATPTHAAQIVVPEASLWIQRLEDLRNLFQRRTLEKLQDLRQTLDRHLSRLHQASPQKRLQLQADQIQTYVRRLSLAMDSALKTHRQNLARLSTKLDALSPLKVFERGYSLVKGPSGQIVRSANELKTNDVVELSFKDGKRQSRVL